MVLILSEEKDLVTSNVIEWLGYYDKKVVRLNDTDYLELLWFEVKNDKTDFEIRVNKSYSFRYSDLTAYWLRRSNIRLKIELPLENPNELELTYIEFCNKEQSSLNIAVLQAIYRLPGFGKIEENETNKLTNLTYAASAGLKIPETFVSKNIKEYCNNSTGQLITKAIYIGGHKSQATGIEISGSTMKIDAEDLQLIGEVKFHSLVQPLLEKSYELRIFYLDGKTFTTAIISQNDPQTQLDFRNYNYTNPNRTVPFELPKTISKSIDTFMNSIAMKSGSLDMVVTPNEEFVFLEVNPLGQFLQVSYPGNFYIEKYIAQYLIKNEHK